METITDLDRWLRVMVRCVTEAFAANPQLRAYHFKIPDRFRAVWDDRHIIGQIRAREYKSAGNWHSFIQVPMNNNDIWVLGLANEPGDEEWDDEMHPHTDMYPYGGGERPQGFQDNFLQLDI